MSKRRIIPDAYTEYEDGHLGVVAPSLANVEADNPKLFTPSSLHPTTIQTFCHRFLCCVSIQ